MERQIGEKQQKEKIYKVPSSFLKHAHINLKQYKKLYRYSIKNPNKFWAQQAEKFINWFSPWKKISTGSLKKHNMRWFVGGKLNACYNCIDRHLETHRNVAAIIWESDNGNESRTISYGELHEKVSRFANVLKKQGVKKGDRVCIYLPMIPEIIIAMLACARIGAIHSVVFGGFSAESLCTRILDAGCRLLITADFGARGGQYIPSKKNADKAIAKCPKVKKVIVVKHTGHPITMHRKRDIWYHEAMSEVDAKCPAVKMDANDPLFILYTSGSTGKPKGILHTIGGYLVFVAMSFKYIFDYHAGDTYWCTADLGWITGHSYLLYGPLLNGGTTLLFEGVPNYPSFSRYWEIIDKHQVNIFYTAPTAIRALRHEGDDWVKKTSRKSLKLLGSVGEPINPDVWEWYYNVVGNKRCPIVDTWWQTETGGILITPLPGATPLKPGSAAWPFFGIVPEIINEKSKLVKDNQSGRLVLKQAWPGLMKTIYGDKKRFVKTYFKEVPGKYLTGDSAYRDKKGYFWIIGRNDDVIKVSGHRIGTGEVESALLSVPAVSEAAVVAVPHEIKGQSIFAYVVKKSGAKSDALKKTLNNRVRQKIGPIATLQDVQWVKALPKTRSGKIMRRILRKIAVNEFDDLGDTSTLANPSVVDDLIAERKKYSAKIIKR
ncbi:acetyl-coenzyme A synthetase [Gammaproteobacteria bacterium SCGC AG-212-F23]|nr:acetyl-coenzyme A synthetase [Gammaproteobacteria bacterium SCGC AG-212-F23]